MRTFLLLSALTLLSVDLVAEHKVREHKAAVMLAYETARQHKMLGMSYNCPFTEITQKRAYDFGWNE